MASLNFSLSSGHSPTNLYTWEESRKMIPTKIQSAMNIDSKAAAVRGKPFLSKKRHKGYKSKAIIEAYANGMSKGLAKYTNRIDTEMIIILTAILLATGCCIFGLIN